MAAKKKAAKKAKKKIVTPELLKAAKEILPRLKTGETTLIQESERVIGKRDNNPLRAALRELLGGKAPYEAMMAQAKEARRPPEREKVPRSRRTRSATGAVVMDDAEVPIVFSTKTADGWGSSTLRVRDRTEDVITSPEGVSYVRARANERADLITDFSKGKAAGLAPARWRLLEDSGKVRTVKKEKKLLKQAKEAKKSKKKVKRASA